MVPGALHGLRVIELGDFVAAPYCGRLLAGLGADVIKVEPPGGDRARRHGPFLHDEPHPERSGLFLALNMGKRGVVLELDRDDDRARLAWLLDTADCLLESEDLERLERLGLTPHQTRRRWPRLVHVSITTFGRRGPWARFRGHALQASAAGAASVTLGEPGRPPLPLPTSQPDYQGGLCGAIGALLACFARDRTGAGQHVDVATADVAAFSGGITSTMYMAQGIPWVREGHRAARSGGFYPYTILPCKDGFICMIARSGHPWKAFVQAIGAPPWTRDPRFRDRARVARDCPDEVDALLAPWLEAHTTEEILAICRDAGIPFSVVRDSSGVAACPQLASREFFVEVHHPDAGTLRYPGAPWKLSRTPWRIERPAPRLGEHTGEVFGEWRAACARSQASSSTDPGRAQAHLHRRDAPGFSLSPGTSGMRPLDGIRVLDFGWVAVGPVIGSLLADMGAEVIKIESSRRLDYCRLVPATLPALTERPNAGPTEASAGVDAAGARRPTVNDPDAVAPAAGIDRVSMFHNYNRGKLGITVDLQHPGAPAVLRRLVAIADVVIENFSPGVLDRAGLDYRTLATLRPELVTIACSSAGQDGPWRELKTFAPSLSSLAGLEALIGYPGERVLGALTYGYADPSNAHHGALAVLAALRHRQRTGEGQYVDMSQLEATVGLTIEPLMDWFMNGRAWGRQGSRHLSMAPHGNYPCRGDDVWVAISVEDDQAWSRLVVALGAPGWARDPRFATLAGRQAHTDELDARLSEWTRGRTPWDVTHALQQARVAAFPVLGLAEQAADPHFQARGLLARPEHPRIGPVEVYAHPIKLSDTPGEVRATAPVLGEHNDRVFRDLLGLGADEIARLRADGVIV